MLAHTEHLSSRCTSPRPRWSAPLKHGVLLVLSVVAGGVCASPAYALIVDRFIEFPEGTANPNQNLVNTTAPSGDRGFSNLPTNLSGVYLGDHWVLSARHAVPNGGSIDIGGDNFPIIPGSVRRLTNGSNFTGSGSDLVLWRVGVNDQGQSPEDISASLRNNLRVDDSTGKLALPIADRLPGFSEDLTIFGRGNTRSLNSTPQVQNGTVVGQNTFFNSSGGVVSDPAGSSFAGYLTSSNPSGAWQWGENRRFGSAFSVSNSIVAPTNVFRTRFDQNGLENEAQAAAGDSGGPVFWQDNNGDWVLAGVLHAVFFPQGVTSGNNLLSAYGAQTGISDLSNRFYSDQIASLRAETEYSVLGDIDLDGTVETLLSGGVPSPDSDLGILVANWQRTFDTANIQSWIAGDLNQDAVVDFADFALLRAGSGGGISTAQFQTALAAAGVAVPEPGALGLVVIALMAAPRRRR